jgi:hypothetical protein
VLGAELCRILDMTFRGFLIHALGRISLGTCVLHHRNDVMTTRWIWIRRHRAVVAAAALGLPDLASSTHTIIPTPQLRKKRIKRMKNPHAPRLHTSGLQTEVQARR